MGDFNIGKKAISEPAYQDLLQTLKLLDSGGRLAGRRIVSLSCSGGEASLVADRGEGTALRFEPFTSEQRNRIESTVTELVSVSNPFDYQTFLWGDTALWGDTFLWGDGVVEGDAALWGDGGLAGEGSTEGEVVMLGDEDSSETSSVF